MNTFAISLRKLLPEKVGWKNVPDCIRMNLSKTRRHRFSSPVLHHTNDSVNVLNLLEGEEAVVESPTHAFEPFVVHYAETFIIPAGVKEYTIAPYGKSAGKECVTIKAYVRF